MDTVAQSIFATHTDADKKCVIVNPVSWSPDVITDLNGRVNALMSAVEKDRLAMAEAFGATLSGGVHINAGYADKNGYIVASLFCVNSSGNVEINALRRSVGKLAKGFAGYKIRVPKRLGIPGLDDDTRNEAINVFIEKLERIGADVSVWC